MKANTITHNGKTFYFAYAQWPARFLKSWALLDSSELQVNASTKYFSSKKLLIQFIQNNF
jgi:YHS domain-containing protein